MTKRDKNDSQPQPTGDSRGGTNSNADGADASGAMSDAIRGAAAQGGIDDPASRGGLRGALLRGLGILLPPLLTLVVLLWAFNAIESYVLTPVESGLRTAWVWLYEDTLTEVPEDARWADPADREKGFVSEGQMYLPDESGRRFIPDYVKRDVDNNFDRFGPDALPPATGSQYWYRYVQLRILPRSYVVPVFLAVFLVVLYFLGKLFALRIGRWFFSTLDRVILRIPIINKIYSSVKQITDFAFSEREIEFNRVVAVQYPSQGIWSIGFVTGNGMKAIADAAGEPVLSVLMPTSPMPMTGFTITVPRSQAVDLDITVDEAIQFVVSCGVVVPNHQQNGGEKV